MRHRPAAALTVAASLSILAMTAHAQKKATAANSPGHPSLQGHREDAPQRPEGHRRPDRLPEHRLAADPGADRLAQRGRARQVRLRPLLRAHDVPRHARRTRPRPTTRSSPRPARARTPTPPTTSRTTTSRSPRKTWRRSWRSRPTASRTSPTPRRTSRPRRGRCSASTTRTSPSPIRKILEVQRDAAYTTHTYKHTTMGFIKDIEDMPNQFEYSKTFFQRWYRPEHTDHHRGRRRRARTGLPARREVLGRLEAGHVHRRHPAGAAATRARSTRTSPGPRRRCPG